MQGLDPKLTLLLDRPREIKWTMAAMAKLGRLAEPPPLADITHRNPHRAFYALLAWLWAALVDGDEEFPKPEALAEHVQGGEKQAVAFALLIQALRQGGVMKAEKKTPSTPDSPSAAASVSSGPTPSSSSAPRVRHSRR
jgi:hypothetical protein